MHYIDIILIAVLAIFTLIGLKRGFIDALLSIFGTLVSLVLAVLAAKPLASFLDQIMHVSNFYATKLQPWFAGLSTDFSSAVTQNTAAAGVINDANGLSSIWKSIFKLFTGDKMVINAGEIPANRFAQLFGGILLLVTAVVVAYILIKLTVFLLSKLFDAVLKNRAISGLDKVLGLIFGFVKGGLLVCIVIAITVFIPNDAIQTTVDKTAITKIIYAPVSDFVEDKVKDIDFNKIVEDYFNKDASEDTNPDVADTEEPAGETTPATGETESGEEVPAV